MLTVAPSGKQKLAISLFTPRFSWVHFMLTGSVALLLQVENATNMAGKIPLKKRTGPMPPSMDTAPL